MHELLNQIGQAMHTLLVPLRQGAGIGPETFPGEGLAALLLAAGTFTLGYLACAYTGRLRHRSPRDLRVATSRWHPPASAPLTYAPSSRPPDLSHLRLCLAHARRDRHTMAILVVGIDAAAANAGERATLRRQCQRRLTNCLRNADIVAHVACTSDGFGGPEGEETFSITLQALDAPLDAARVAQRIFGALHRPFRINDRPLRMSTHLGISIFPEDGTCMQELQKKAQKALQQARSVTGNSLRFANARLNRLAVRHRRMSQQLHEALRGQGLRLFYQPVIEACSGETVALEALLRWQHPQAGMLPPSHFLPVAVRHNIMPLLNDWVLTQACAQIQNWRQAGLPQVPVTVNLHNVMLTDATFIPRLQATLAATALPPSVLIMEISESALLPENRQVQKALTAMHEMGIGLCLDDFGATQAALTPLTRMPISFLKLDRSYAQQIQDGSCDMPLLQTLIGLGQALKLKVVVKGVEEKRQFREVAAQGGQFIQGHLFSPPLPASEVATWLQNACSTINGPAAIASSEPLCFPTPAASGLMPTTVAMHHPGQGQADLDDPGGLA